MTVIVPEQLTLGDANVTYAYTVGPAMFSPHFMVGLSGFREAVTLAAGFCGAATRRPIVEDFLDLMENELLSLE